jgi:hypothetical protein
MRQLKGVIPPLTQQFGDGAAHSAKASKSNPQLLIESPLLLNNCFGFVSGRGFRAFRFRRQFVTSLGTGISIGFPLDAKDYKTFWHPALCWFSWAEQTRLMERLLAYRFEWVLPGQGRIHHGIAEEMHRHLERYVA